jgi:hypothetical protein
MYGRGTYEQSKQIPMLIPLLSKFCSAGHMAEHSSEFKAAIEAK